jgi:hypothetical protein
MITVRLEPLPPYDEDGNPAHWLVINSRNVETRRFGARDRALAEAYVTEFNITAYQTDRRMRDARPQGRSR